MRPFYQKRKEGYIFMIITLTDPTTKNTASIDSLGAQLISMKDQNRKEYI